MKKIKKMIFLLITLIFLYLISWYNFGYRPKKPSNRPYFVGIIKNKNLKISFESQLSYLYTDDILTLKKKLDFDEIRKTIKPKNIVIKTVNIFGGEKIVAVEENPTIEITTENSIPFTQIPFYTKEIIVTTEMNFKGKDMTVERKFYPYFKFGIWEFWYLPFPPLWEFINGKTLFIWGYL